MVLIRPTVQMQLNVFILSLRGKGDVLFHQVVRWGLEDQEDPRRQRQVTLDNPDAGGEVMVSASLAGVRFSVLVHV